LCPGGVGTVALHRIVHFGDKSFHAVSVSGVDNEEKVHKNTHSLRANKLLN